MTQSVILSEAKNLNDERRADCHALLGLAMTRRYVNMEEIYRLLGKRIREERKRLGITQESLATRAKISVNFLGHIERGTKKASLKTIERLAYALEVPAGRLFHQNSKSYQLPEEDLFIKRIRLLVRDRSEEDKRTFWQLAKALFKEKK